MYRELVAEEGEGRVGEGGWTYRHDEGGQLRQLFGLLLHDQIFDADGNPNPNPNPNTDPNPALCVAVTADLDAGGVWLL